MSTGGWEVVSPEPKWEPVGNVKGPPGDPGPPGPPGAPGESPDTDLPDLTLLFENGLI